MKFWGFAIFMVLSAAAGRPVCAQSPVTLGFRHDVKIVIDSDTIKNPWAGGLNSPVFSRIDLNHDGTEDLFAFDRTHEKIFTFLALRVQDFGTEWGKVHTADLGHLHPGLYLVQVRTSGQRMSGLKFIIQK